MSAIVGHSDIGDELIGWVPEPHSFNISCDNVGSFMTLGDIVMLNGSAHGVRECFDKNAK